MVAHSIRCLGTALGNFEDAEAIRCFHTIAQLLQSEEGGKFLEGCDRLQVEKAAGVPSPPAICSATLFHPLTIHNSTPKRGEPQPAKMPNVAWPSCLAVEVCLSSRMQPTATPRNRTFATATHSASAWAENGSFATAKRSGSAWPGQLFHPAVSPAPPRLGVGWAGAADIYKAIMHYLHFKASAPAVWAGFVGFGSIFSGLGGH